MSLRWRRVRGFFRWAFRSWATRSLAVGAVATALDVVVLLICVKGFGLSAPVGAMVGVACGSTLTFFANRQLSFRDHEPQLAPQAFKFILATVVGMGAHAAIVFVLVGRWHVPLVLAKMMADVAVFSVGQLLLLRYVVFPKRAESAATPTAALIDLSEAGLGRRTPLDRSGGRWGAKRPVARARPRRLGR